MTKLKVVVDTNVVISGIFWRGPPHQILKSWVAGHFQPLLSLEVLEEYQQTLQELTITKKLSAPGSILDHLFLNTELLDPITLPKQICDDPDDDKFIALALTGNAKYLVSGDKALLRLKQVQKCQIITASQFVQKL